LALPKLDGLANFEREKMNADAGPGIRFCDEYERLMSDFLRALSAWTQMRSFQRSPGSPSSEHPVCVISPCAEAELARSHGGYTASLWALRLHSRSCLLCAETLRVVNGEATKPSAFRAGREHSHR